MIHPDLKKKFELIFPDIHDAMDINEVLERVLPKVMKEALYEKCLKLIATALPVNALSMEARKVLREGEMIDRWMIP